MNDARLFKASPAYRTIMDDLRARGVQRLISVSSNEPDRLARAKRYLELLDELEREVDTLAKE